MKTTKSILGKALLPAVVVLALGIFIGLGIFRSRLIAAPTPPAQATDYDVQGAPGDSCYPPPFPCYSTQAFWLAGLDANVFTTGCGQGPNGATDGLHFIFTAGAFSTAPSPGLFTEFPNGTATLTGHIESTILPGRGFNVNITFANFTATPDPMGPLKELSPSCYGTGPGQVDISTWHYYQTVNVATLTGTGNYAGAVVQLTPVMHFPEFGLGASGKDVMVGGSGWFTWNVTSQPTNTSFHLNTNPPAGFQGDFNIVTGNPHQRGCDGSIGDFVWQDTNGNGCQDAGEPGMANVQVDLYVGLNCGGVKVLQGSTMTDANGHYLFDHLCAGLYTVCFHTPNGFTPTGVQANCGANSNQKDSDCSSTECNICVSLPTDNSSDVTIDCGYIPGCTGTIGDFVWQDDNQNGCQDAGEPGIQGVQVDLFSGCGAAKTMITSQMTDANGHYLFTGLCAGNYTVCFHTPTGFTPTVRQSAGCNGGVNPNLLDSDCSAADCNICVNLPTNQSSDITIDCGYIPNTPCTGTIGDFVWQDNNTNGCQDNGEPGIAGVQVDLYLGCGAGKVLITSQNTGANGQYLFTNLCAGQYTVCFHSPVGFTNTVLGANCGANSTTKDSNCSATDCNICVTLPANNSNDLTIDCGYIPTNRGDCQGTIGDFVWQDTNGNGCQDAGEPGIAGVRVDLYAGCGAEKTLIGFQNTDANGQYLFNNLCAGMYTVCFNTPSGATPTSVGANCGALSTTKDSNCSATDCNICVTLTANEGVGSVDRSIDCGYIVTCPPCVNPDLGLGAGANFSVFELANGKVSITGPAGGIVGMVAIGPNGSLDMSGDEFITGTIKLAAGAKFQNSAHFTPVVQTNVDLSAAITAAKNRSTSAAALPCTQTINKIDGVAVTTITGVVGTNVICVKDISISGKKVTVTGPVGAKFIFNVTGQFTLTGGGNGPQIRAAGGVKPSDILYNLVGTQNMTVAFSGGGGGTNCCAAIVDGTLLAVNRSVQLSPGLVNGEVISGKDISIVSGSAIKCPTCQ